MKVAEDPSVFRFAVFELEVRARELRRSGSKVKLATQPFQLLELLVRRAGDVVTREEIRRHLWSDETFVDYEQGINSAVRQVRAALGDQADRPRFLETLPKVGYRLMAPVETTGNARPASEARRLWIPAAVLVGVVGVVGMLVWSLTRTAGVPAHRAVVRGPDPASPVLLVLPFEPMNIDGEQSEEDYLGDGLTEELIVQLGRRYGGALNVIARTTSMKYKGTRKSIGEIADELNADYLVEGSVRREGQRVRITAQLIRSLDDSHVWGANYERQLVDMLDLQTEVGDRIADALGLQLLPGGDGTVIEPRDSEAYDAYLRGMALLREGRHQRMAEARTQFVRATTLDPGFARGWVALARAIWYSERDTAGMALAREAVDRALALDDELPEAHWILAEMRFYDGYDVDGARASWQRAIELNPGYAEAHHSIAAAWSVRGMHEEAIAAVRRALALDPANEAVAADVGWYFYFARRYDEAIDHSRRALEINPQYFWAHRCIVLASVLNGEPELAVTELRVLAERARHLGLPVESLVAGLAVENPEEALAAYWRWEVERIETRAFGTRFGPDALAVALAGLGRKNEALDALEELVKRRWGWRGPFLAVDPWFDGLREEKRFGALLQRLTKPPR